MKEIKEVDLFDAIDAQSETLDFLEKNLKKYNLKMIVKLHPMDFLCAHIKGCYNNITIFDNNSKDIDIKEKEIVTY